PDFHQQVRDVRALQRLEEVLRPVVPVGELAERVSVEEEIPALDRFRLLPEPHLQRPGGTHGGKRVLEHLIEENARNPLRPPKLVYDLPVLPARLFDHEQDRLKVQYAEVFGQELSELLVFVTVEREEHELPVRGLREKKRSERQLVRVCLGVL